MGERGCVGTAHRQLATELYASLSQGSRSHIRDMGGGHRTLHA